MATTAALRSAGWTPSYRCDIKTLRLPEYPPIHDAAMAFLTTYGGLTLDVRGETTFGPSACFDNHRTRSGGGELVQIVTELPPPGDAYRL